MEQDVDEHYSEVKSLGSGGGLAMGQYGGAAERGIEQGIDARVARWKVPRCFGGAERNYGRRRADSATNQTIKAERHQEA